MTHYFKNDSLKKDIRQIQIEIANQPFKFVTDAGVFSKKGLDFGTRILLESIDVANLKGEILDFGCGYGPIGIYISKMTGIGVDMVDVNNRALELARKNALLNQVDVNIFESNVYENIHKQYNYIVTNPPIRVGNDVLFEILIDAKEHLIKGGELWFVINKNQGAKSVMKRLENQYSIRIVNKKKGFYIFCATND